MAAANAAAANAAAILMAPKSAASGPTAMGDKRTIWAQAIEANKAAVKNSEGGNRPDGNVFFVGSRRGGKSILLNRFLYPEKSETPKPTEGMEYTYIRKSQVTDYERKDVAHLFEISGSDALTAEVSSRDALFLSMRQVTTAAVVIVVDLSKPNEAMDTLESWLNIVRNRTEKVYERLRQRGSKLPDQLKARARKQFVAKPEEGKAPEPHEDAASIDFTGINVVVVATKWDMFANTDAELRRVMARTLRYLCHCAGASLLYVGNLTGNSEQRTAQADRMLMTNFRSLLNFLIFGPSTSGPRSLYGALKLPVQLDHLQPLVIPAGSDKLSLIGRPRGGGSAAGSLEEWREVFRALFPPSGSEVAKATGFDSPAYQPQYAEDDVDELQKRKNDELRAYIEQQQQNVERWKAAQRVARK
ncbi:cytoplasmic dynein 2 light intermediate chain 1 [Pycnococcus provasolii]|uniref:Cytoplasmic dynein 2 light intermediate chain 1 n=1 Tax=Pycnococcus provasolii TaxID=41880 RepID=A0A830H5W0_9CHLO|nr:cytoplasmic dynein 2 light intermediate chain 1 [Pycnococcus provasolii]